MNVHPWHDIEIGEKKPKIVNVIVEIPKGSTIKYELDKKTGLLKLDRYMYSAVHYPADYGFIPRTLWDDNDPLDVFIITHRPTYPLALTEVKVIGVVSMSDNKEKDNKIIGVHAHDPRYSQWDSIDEVPRHFLKELKHFLETYKELQGKVVKVFKIYGTEKAYRDILRAEKMYLKKYANAAINK